MKTTLQITTQYDENYGAHDWNGEGECPQYWKNKGEQIFTLRVNPELFWYAEKLFLDTIAFMLEKESNEYIRYNYVGHEFIFMEPIELDSDYFENIFECLCVCESENKKAFN
jgi:hypothetical protein